MQDSARETVPWGPSIACSTPAAIEWVAQWKASNDPSGRLISSHNDSTSSPTANGNGNGNANGNGVAVANGHGAAEENGHGAAAANGKVNGAAEVAVAV